MTVYYDCNSRGIEKLSNKYNIVCIGIAVLMTVYYDCNSRGIETTLKLNIFYLGIDVLMTVTVGVLNHPS